MEPLHRHDSDSQAHAWLVHLTSGTATRSDGEAFRLWCTARPENAEAFARARALWEALGPAAALRAHERGAREQARARHAVRVSRRAFLGGAVAASIAGLLMVRSDVFTRGSTPDGRGLRTRVGEQKRITVAPGVDLEMNTDTDIAVRERGGVVTGMHLRQGEAVVRIDAGRKDPFVVEVADGRLFSAPGASFAVRCADDAATVTCLGGQAVINRAGTNVPVKPSQQVAFDANGIGAAMAVNLDTALAWRERVLIYDNQPLADVVADINRYRPGRIVITDHALGERRVHARFTLDQMGEVATLIQDAYGAHATHLPGGWVLLS
jgi:transmembrane sensor